MFTLLGFILGRGERDVPVPRDRRMWLDMLFTTGYGPRLGIEYDGAYWHRGREASDERKTWHIIDSGLAHEVIRIREEPLEVIGRYDIVVPPRATAGVIAQTVLLHLQHHGLQNTPNLWNETTGLLTAAHERLDEKHLRCQDCIKVLAAAARYMPLL
ncbi:hypothetical protein [Sanguibacter sp. Leaf3]|uniref:hypothetical protein n=1 Tax=Sanguibacter sp. Leaf3 TaxID=1736209 RepID=UPI00070050F9|nr:hypothetical protein [Sanguibacter sp. Leaf3]KQT96597.1 hypothetical protein ASG53_16090 [Sanguibacter sp. Leaf3]